MKALISQNLHHFKIILYIVVFIVCFGIAIGLLSRNSMTSLYGGKKPMAQSEDMMKDQPWMKLSAQSTQIAVGDDITFTVMADSHSADITGYDLLFKYDPEVLEITQVNSVVPLFDVYTYPNATYLAITGTKKLSAATTAVLSNSQLLTIVARAKKAGTVDASILPNVKLEKTKMVDSKAQIMIPVLGPGVQVSVR